MKYTVILKEADALFSLPQKKLLDILSDASEAELKVLLALAACPDSDGAREAAGVSEEEFNSAVAYLRGAKLISVQGKKMAETKEKALPKEKEKKKTAESKIDLSHDRSLPEYSSDDIVRLTSGDKVLGSILDEAQQVFGKVFNTVEMNYILAMRDHLGLDGEYILMLLQYFRAENKPLCYAVRVADELVKKGINEPSSLEAYIRRRDTFKGTEGKYRELFGIGSRALTSFEEKYFHTWATELKIPFELIKLAFDRTVEKKGKHEKFKLNGILSKWHSHVLFSVEAVLESEKQGKPKKQETQGASFDIDDFFNAALERTYGKKE